MGFASHRAAVAAILAALAAASPAGAATGDFDTSFGQNGRTILPINGNDARANDVVIQADGKIVVAGNSFQDGTNADSAFFVARLNADGSPDTGFGSGGVRTINIDIHPNGDDRALAVALGPGGTIVVAGSARAGASFGNLDVAIVRLDSSGTPDPGFGAGGIVTHSLTANGADAAQDVTVQADGRVVTAGGRSGAGASMAVLRFESDGDPDNSWDGDGEVNVSFGGIEEDVASTIEVVEGEKLLIGGTADISAGAAADFALARLMPANGALDPAFGSGGMTTTPGPDNERVRKLAMAPNGTIFAIGDVFDIMTFNGDMGLARYSANGLADPNFAGGGVLKAGFQFGNAGGLLVQGDGKPLAVGQASPDGVNVDHAFWRTNANGSPDAALGEGGRRTQAVGASADGASAAAVQTAPGSGQQRMIAAGVIFDGKENALIGAFKIADEGTDTGPPPPPPPPVAPATPTADLAIELELTDFPGGGVAGSPYPSIREDGVKYSFAGQEDLQGVVLAVNARNNASISTNAAVRAAFPGYLTPRGLRTDKACRSSGSPPTLATCDALPLKAGETREAWATLGRRTPRAGGISELHTATIRHAVAGVVDPNPANDADALRIVPLIEPPSTADALNARLRELRGRVRTPAPPAAGARAAGATSRLDTEIARRNRLARVEIALLRVDGGARGFTGLPDGEGSGSAADFRAGVAARAAGSPKCRWLASSRGTFRSERPRRGVCDEPRWLKASLGRARRGATTRAWTFDLPKKIPAGRYVAYTRGVNGAGFSIDTYTKRAKNRLELRVP